MEDRAFELENAVNDFVNAKAEIVDWDNSVNAGKWNNKEILGHLIDSANVNLQRFVRATYEDGFKLIYHQDEWVAAQHYRDASSKDLIQLWKQLNYQIARVLKHYPAERRVILCDTGKHGANLHTIEFLAADYIEHLQHHLHQIC